MRYVLTAIAVLALVSPVWADLYDGVAAYDRGDYPTALREIRPLAEHGHFQAQFFLGVMYSTGNGVPRNYAEAVKWFRKSAENSGYGPAQAALGAMYFEGKGVPQDYVEAVKWYRKAAEDGYAPAQSALGAMYDEGKGVLQDYAEAVKWYGKAAEDGYAPAQSALGAMYDEGKGVPRDNVTAQMWYNLSAAQGDETAAKYRDSVAKRITPADVLEAQRLARVWLEKHGKAK